jgi:thiamine-phosphate pyrophosphorylase
MKPIFDLRLYLVTDPHLGGDRLIYETVRLAVAGGVTMVQLRGPNVPGGDLVAEARALKYLLTPLGIPLIVNDRIDVALASDADGVHIGQDDISPNDARYMLGDNKLIGFSVGTPEQWEASKASLYNVDYIGTGPVFGTATKSDAGQPIGVDGLAWIIERANVTRPTSEGLRSFPVVAIGGVGPGNAADVMAARPAGIAVVSAIMAAADPEAAARGLRSIVDDALGPIA